MFLSYGWGNAPEGFLPDKTKPGRDYTLTPSFAPLAKHKERFSIIQGMQNKNSVEGHWGSTFWLTGASRYAKPGSSFSNTISADQVAAKQWGVNTRYPSLQLDCADANGSGHGVGLSLGWDDLGKLRARRHLTIGSRLCLREDEMKLRKRVVDREYVA